VSRSSTTSFLGLTCTRSNFRSSTSRSSAAPLVSLSSIEDSLVRCAGPIPIAPRFFINFCPLERQRVCPLSASPFSKPYHHMRSGLFKGISLVPGDNTPAGLLLPRFPLSPARAAVSRVTESCPLEKLKDLQSSCNRGFPDTLSPRRSFRC